MTSQTSSLTSESPALPQALVLLFALCCGAIVANLYYAQPIIELIAPDVGLSAERASLIVSLTQIGYALGLLFLVPLADLLESHMQELLAAWSDIPGDPLARLEQFVRFHIDTSLDHADDEEADGDGERDPFGEVGEDGRASTGGERQGPAASG